VVLFLKKFGQKESAETNTISVLVREKHCGKRIIHYKMNDKTRLRTDLTLASDSNPIVEFRRNTRDITCLLNVYKNTFWEKVPKDWGETGSARSMQNCLENTLQMQNIKR